MAKGIMEVGRKAKLTLIKPTPALEYRIGGYLFKHMRPTAVFFTDKEFKETVKLDRKAIDHYFKVEAFEGKIEEGKMIVFNDKGVKADPAKSELEEILENGDPKVLVAYIKNKGDKDISFDVMKKILDSLKIEVKQGMQKSDMISALEAFVIKQG